MFVSRLVVALAVVCVVSGSVGCRFYVGASQPDGDIVDASPDAQDQDPDGGDLDAEVAPDAETPDAAIEECGALGGVCTSNPNALCPPGTHPQGDDDPLDCGGHCCVPDAPSTCNNNPDTNCSMMPACTGCWAPATDTALMCDGGRPCCEWTCGG